MLASTYVIQWQTGLHPWAAGPRQLWAALLAADTVTVPEVDKWRVPYLWRLLAERL